MSWERNRRRILAKEAFLAEALDRVTNVAPNVPALRRLEPLAKLALEWLEIVLSVAEPVDQRCGPIENVDLSRSGVVDHEILTDSLFLEICPVVGKLQRSLGGRGTHGAALWKVSIREVNVGGLGGK
jgi:hypothetical protein